MPDVDAVNAGYARSLLEQYLENPEAVPSEWRALFESGDGDLIEALPGLARLLENLRETNGHAEPAPAPAPAPSPAQAAEPAPTPPDDVLLGGVAAAMSLVKALRTHGHLAARLDPLGSEPVGDPALEPERLQPRLTPELQARIPASLLRVHAPGETLADVLPELQETYSGTSAYEIEHISDHEQRIWLREAIESGRYRRELTAGEQKRLLMRLSEVEGLERYLRRVFLGQKQFSVEGLDTMIPMLDEAIDLAAAGGAGRPFDARGTARPAGRAAGADPWRCRLPGAGNRRRDAQPRRARGLRDWRHAAPDREQSDRLHHRSGRRPLDPLLERPRQGLRLPDHPCERR